ncbi:MAG: phosphatidylserine decarboxylase [Planctomycetota bacterium]
MRWPFTRHGTEPLLWSTVVLLGGAVVLWRWTPVPWAASVPFALWLFVLSFFRDPERRAGGDDLDLVAPADGLVADIVTVTDPALDVPCLRIGIFLSVFNVHVNRVPCAGTVSAVEQRAGKCLDARDPRAAEENRAATITLERDDGRSVAVRQVTGLIARRIVCPVDAGQRFGRGERYGMIRFGSRTELVIPVADLEQALVSVGETVRCGETLLARLKPGRAGAASAG